LQGRFRIEYKHGHLRAQQAHSFTLDSYFHICKIKILPMLKTEANFKALCGKVPKTAGLHKMMFPFSDNIL
jgi:hypothetical protein